MPIDYKVYGAFVPTSNDYDPQLIYELDIKTTEFKDFLVRLRESITDMAYVVNVKRTGFLNDTEFVNGKQLFPRSGAGGTGQEYRPVYELELDFGSLPNTTSKSVAHGLNLTGLLTTWEWLFLSGAATNPSTGAGISLPNEGIYVEVDATNVTVTTTDDKTSFTKSKINLQYVK